LSLNTIESAPDASHDYDANLLHFAVSISWRTTLFHVERNEVRQGPKFVPSEEIRSACRIWRHYLLGKRATVGAFSQHIFLVHDKEIGRHHVAGGCVYEDRGLVLSQVGPLQIIGLFRRPDVADHHSWKSSEVSRSGGIIHPVKEWRVGTSRDSTVSLELCKLLCAHERKLVQRVVNIAQNRASEDPR
jgi:hypothetical protein